ncbi:cation diffusion facilitator family transporter [Bacteroidota bacterium]
MNHHHADNLKSISVKLIITLILNLLISIVELIGGIISGSLSLISDALHNFSDGVSVILSYIAVKLKTRKNSVRHTFGLKRAEILVAVINSSLLIMISVYLFYEAIQRLLVPSKIDAVLMVIVASFGLIANSIGSILLHKNAKTSLNIKSSYLHLISDAVSSFAIIIGALTIYFFQLSWIDPLLTILMGIYMIREGVLIISKATHVLLEGAPMNIDISELEKVVTKIDEVEDIHHIHLWTVGENDIHLQAHVNIKDRKITECAIIRDEIEKILQSRFGVNHITLQFESDFCDDPKLVHQHR